MSVHSEVTVANPTAAAAKSAKNAKFVRQLQAIMYVLPAAVLIVGLFVYSIVFTLGISFTQWNGLAPAKFAGVANYIRMFHDPQFSVSIANTFIWVIAMVILPVGLGLAAALLLENIRFKNVFKTVFYLPYAISLTTTGVIWSFLLSNEGLSNLFTAVGWKSLANVDWLNSTPLNTYAMIIASTWQIMGTNMLLYLVGLQNLDKSVVEAALLDGAHSLRMFWHITFPLLRPITTVVISISLVNGLQVFNIIWVMTQGGPYDSSQTLATWMYEQSFEYFRLGYGSAIAVLLTVLVFLLTGWYLRRSLQRSAA